MLRLRSQVAHGYRTHQVYMYIAVYYFMITIWSSAVKSIVDTKSAKQTISLREHILDRRGSHSWTTLVYA